MVDGIGKLRQSQCDERHKEEHEQIWAKVPEEFLKIQAVFLLGNHSAKEKGETKAQCNEEANDIIERAAEDFRYADPAGEIVALVADSVENQKETARKQQRGSLVAVDGRIVIECKENIDDHGEHKRLAEVEFVRENIGDGGESRKGQPNLHQHKGVNVGNGILDCADDDRENIVDFVAVVEVVLTNEY